MPPAVVTEKPILKIMSVKAVKKTVRAGGKTRGLAHVSAADDHQRLKASKINAARMDQAVAELKAGKGVQWDPFKP